MDDHDQQFCLRWNNHQSTIISVFGTLKENEALVDCTLAAEGKFLKAHKVVLSACSPYFATLLQEQYDKHPIFILKDVKYQELCAMMDYMYHGEVNISQDQLAALLKAAESLQIKGLSDNRSTGGSTVPKQEHHRASMPPTPKLSGGYTLEQTKRARIALGPGSIDNQEMGSREGSSSPSRRRRKMGRRSIENATTDVHDNANSSQQPPGPNAAVALSGVGAITAAASALAAGTIATSLPAGASLAGTSTSLAAPAVMSGAAISGTTTSTTKKTESLKAASQQSSDAMNTDNVQGSNLANIDAVSEHLHHHSTHHHHAGDIVDKSSNHKQQKQTSKDASGSGGGPSSELVIEPKSEYDDEGNDEAVEDLTLDEEDMAIDDLDQNAGTSQGGEGSSHGYAPWQPDRSQNELLLETQEAQQRDPQGSLTPTHSSNVALQHQPQRPRMRLKVSPLSSPIATVAPGSSVIKFEPSSTNDEDNEDKIPTMCIEKKVSVTSAGTAVSNVGSGHGVSGCNLDDEEDDEDSEQPCDLRLSSHFKLNLVSIALQQAAAAAASGDQQTAAAMAAAVIGSGTAGSTGMPPATQLQHAALQSIAAAATSSHHHHGSSHSLHQQHSHHALMNFPTHAAAAAGAVTPTRRYSSSSAGTNLTAAAAVAVGGSSGPASVGTATNAAGTALGVSTSSAVAPHTPTSSGNVVGGGVMGASGSNSAGAPGSSGTGGSGGGNNSNTSWGGAYTCDRCGNSYARPHSLNRHVRFECGVEPKFECPICHKKSKHKHNLVLHMRTHQHR